MLGSGSTPAFLSLEGPLVAPGFDTMGPIAVVGRVEEDNESVVQGTRHPRQGQEC